MSPASTGPDVTYHRAASVADARRHLARRGARVYAGGTDLVVALRDGAEWVHGVRHLVDIKGLDALRDVVVSNGEVRIGALVTAAELAASRVLCRAAPVVVEAAGHTSAPWVRARGTVGGNLMTPHAAGDVATALVALGSKAEFVTPSGRRFTVPVQGMGARRMPNGSLLLAVRAPVAPSSGYERVGHRLAFCRATLAVAVVRRASATSVAVAGVAPRPEMRDALVPTAPDTERLIDGLVARVCARLGPGTPSRRTRR